jgi:hypothetical protein
MGRGRAKAKQTKVARELKYRSFDTDFGALERELHGDELSSDDRMDETDGDGSDPSADDARAPDAR